METATVVQCTHCCVEMTSWRAQASPIRYYQCPRCQHVHSSLYDEVFKRGAGARFVDPDAPARPAVAKAAEPVAQPVPEPARADPLWSAVKARATSWFERLEREELRHRVPPAANDSMDALEVLGLAPGASAAEVRTAYRKAALAHHPDRGGDADAMVRLNRAYDALRAPPSPALAVARDPNRHR